MAARTLMTAPSTIDGGPETRTIHHRILYNIENPYHLLSLNSYLLIIKEILSSVVDMGHTVVEFGELA